MVSSGSRSRQVRWWYQFAGAWYRRVQPDHQMARSGGPAEPYGSSPPHVVVSSHKHDRRLRHAMSQYAPISPWSQANHRRLGGTRAGRGSGGGLWGACPDRRLSARAPLSVAVVLDVPRLGFRRGSGVAGRGGGRGLAGRRVSGARPVPGPLGAVFKAVTVVRCSSSWWSRSPPRCWPLAMVLAGVVGAARAAMPAAGPAAAAARWRAALAGAGAGGPAVVHHRADALLGVGGRVNVELDRRLNRVVP